MQKVFDNLINGNLEDAKKGAKRYSFHGLEAYARDVLDWSAWKAFRESEYLKGAGSFQSYCDAK